MQKRGSVEILYDGDCPFCARYTALTDLRARFAIVTLTNARDVPGRVQALREAGFDLNDGMLVIHDGTHHFGAGAVSFLARHSQDAGPLTALLNRIMMSDARARLFYPVLREGRNLALRLMGRRPLE